MEVDMAGRQKAGKRASSKNIISEEAEFFAYQFEIFRRKNKILRKDLDFAKLVNLSPSYISKIKKGILTIYENVIDHFLPVLVAFGPISTAQQVRQWVEPAYKLISRHDLESIVPRILEVMDRSLDKEETRDRAEAFASSIEGSFLAHPGPYKLEEVQKLIPPSIEKIKSKLHRFSDDQGYFDYIYFLSQYHNPEVERLLIQEVENYKDSFKRHRLIEHIVISGGYDAIVALPHMMGDDPDYSLLSLLDKLPADTVHQAKDAWISLISNSSNYWKDLAARIFAKDPDQCEIVRVLKMASEGEDGKIWEIARSALNFNLDFLISLSAIEYLLTQIDRINHSIFNEYRDEWKFTYIEKSLREITRNGNPLPQSIRDLTIKYLLFHLKQEPHPAIAAINTLALPGLMANVQDVAKLLDWKFPLLMDDEKYQYIVCDSIEALISMGAPKAKQYLLDIYQNATSPSMKKWAIGTLITKTDMKFTLSQKLRFNLKPIYYYASVQNPHY
jgi:transcriptional regulator with XRE-family HTH domain